MTNPTDKLTGFYLPIAILVTYLAMTAKFCYGESFSVLRSSEGDSYKPCFNGSCACNANQVLQVNRSERPTCEDIDKIEWSLGTSTMTGCGQLTWSGADISIASCLTESKVMEVWNFTKFDRVEVEFSQSETELKLKVDPVHNWSGLLLRLITQCVNTSSYQCMFIKFSGEQSYPLPQKLFLSDPPESPASTLSTEAAMLLTSASTLTITPSSTEVFPSDSAFSGLASSVVVADSTSFSYMLGATSAVSGVASLTEMASPSEFSPKLDSSSVSALISAILLTSTATVSTISISSSRISPLSSASAISSAAFTALSSYSGTSSVTEVFVPQSTTPTLFVATHPSLSAAGSALNSPSPSTVVSISSNTSPSATVGVSSTTSISLALFATTSASLSEADRVSRSSLLPLVSSMSSSSAATSTTSVATSARVSASSITPASSTLDATSSTRPSIVLTITAVLNQPSSTLLPSASPPSKESGNGVTLAVIAGVAAGGGVATIILLIAAIVYCRRRRRRKPQTSVPKDYILYNYASTGPTVATNQQANSKVSPSAQSLPNYSSYTELSGDGGVVTKNTKFQSPTSRPTQIGSSMNEAVTIPLAGRVVDNEHGGDRDSSAKETLGPSKETYNRGKSISKPNYDPPKPPELVKAKRFSSVEDIRYDERQKRDPSPMSQSLSSKDNDKPDRPLPPVPNQFADALRAALESKRQNPPAVLPKPMQLPKNADYKTKFAQALVPSPPVLVPSPPVLVPSPPALVPSPPALVPSPPVLVPSPPAVVPSPPAVVPSPPAVVPSPPAVVPSPPAFVSSPPALVSRPPALVPSPSALVPSSPAVTSRPQVLASSSPVLTSIHPAGTSSHSTVASNPSLFASSPPALTSNSAVPTSKPPALKSKPPAKSSKPTVPTLHNTKLDSSPPAKTSKLPALTSRHTELDSSPSELTSRPITLGSRPPAPSYSLPAQTSSPAAVVQIPVKYNESSDRMPDKSLPRVPRTYKRKGKDPSVRLVKNLGSQIPKVFSKEQTKDTPDGKLDYVPPAQDKPETNDTATRPAVRGDSSNDQGRISNKKNSAGSVKPPRPPVPKLLEQRQSYDEPPTRPPPKLPQALPPSKDLSAPKLSPKPDKHIKETGVSRNAPENVITVTENGKNGRGNKQASYGDTSSQQQDRHPSFENPVTHSSPSNGHLSEAGERSESQQDEQQRPSSGRISPAMNTPSQQSALPSITASKPVVPKPKARKSSDQVAISGQTEVEILGAEARDSLPDLRSQGDHPREVPENILPKPVPAQRKPRQQPESTSSPSSGLAYNIV